MDDLVQKLKLYAYCKFEIETGFTELLPRILHLYVQ